MFGVTRRTLLGVPVASMLSVPATAEEFVRVGTFVEHDVLCDLREYANDYCFFFEIQTETVDRVRYAEGYYHITALILGME